MRRWHEKRKLNNAGFTLVEMIVVLVILVIMLSLSAVGIMAWQDWSKMKQLNANAETIFIAAQTQLSDFSSSGSLESRVIDQIKSGDDYLVKEITSANIGDITDPDGVPYEWEQVWSTGEHKGTIVSVSSKPGEYQDFLENKALDPGTQLLFELITAYVYDKSILNDSAILIEFSPDAAQVLAVCYSRSAEKLSYDPDEAGAVCVLKRDETTRNDIMLGYYGVKTLAMRIEGKTDNTLHIGAGDFLLRNGSILDAVYVPENEEDVFGSGKDLTFIFSVYNPETEGSRNRVMSFEFAVNSSDMLPSGMKQAQGKNARVADVKYYHHNIQVGDTTQFRIPVWIELTDEGRRAIRVALDAADIQAQSITSALALGLDTGDDVREVDRENAKEAFLRTYSFYRFGLDVDKIYLGLTIQDNTDPSSDPDDEIYTDEEGVYTTFASISRNNTDKKANYEIANGRHLYNMRFVEDYADKIVEITPESTELIGTLQNNRDWNTCYVRSFKLIQDIDWHSFTAYGYMGSNAGENNFFDSYDMSDPVNSGIGVAGLITETEEFPSFRQLNAGDSFSAERKNGNGSFGISNLTITTDANEFFGVYGYGAQDDNKKLHTDALVSARAEGLHPTGLFVYNFGTIKNLVLEKHKVFGTYMTGGFVGENFGTISDLELKNETNTAAMDKTEDTFVNKIVALKLLIPALEGSGDSGNEDQILKTYIKEQLYSRNTSFVVGILDVGGICGYQKYANTGSTTVSYNALKNEAQVAGQAYLGGIIGRSIVHYETKTDGYTVISLPAGAQQNEMRYVSFCDNENYGRIQALPIYDTDGNSGNGSGPDYRAAFYIGGICGMACDNIVNDSDTYLNISTSSPTVLLKNCRSYWLYTDEEIDALINGKKDGFSALQSELRGSFTGCLVGFARRVMFENCSTELNEERENNGNQYIFGKYYTGGFAGVMSVCAIKNEEDSKTVNAVNIIGRNAVGGFAGLIGAPAGFDPKKDDADTKLVRYQYAPWDLGLDTPIDGDPQRSGKISNVINTGLTFATGGKEDMAKNGWVGGICGYNAENITDCSSVLNVYAKQTMLKLIDMTSDDDDLICDYAGGLAGYNSLTINGDTGTSSVNTVVYGDNYVDGAVGAADVGGENESEAVKTVMECYLVNAEDGIDVEGISGFKGSYILARHDNAGGICGWIKRAGVFNNNADITGDFIVHADNYAGGYIGRVYGEPGIAAPRYYARLKAGNGGKQIVKADGFYAGGFAGAVTAQVTDRIATCVSGVSSVTAKYFAGGFAGAVIIPQMSKTDSNLAVPPGFYSVDNENMMISALAAAGGCYGYYEVASEYWPDAPEVLRSYLETPENMNNAAAFSNTLDSIGGDAMKVSSITYIDNKVADHGINNGNYINNLQIEAMTVNADTVQAQYYAGGLFGYVSAAQSIYIEHGNSCNVSTLAQDTLDGGFTYAGGIMGKIGERMVLNNCTSTGVISSGSVYYGALCELNMGTIQNCTVGYAFAGNGESGYLGDHDYVGGLCGLNAVSGRLIGTFNGMRNRDGYPYPNDVSGRYCAGGLCGANDGHIALSDGFGYVIDVCGEEYAGGVCGVNRGTITAGDTGTAAHTEGRNIQVKGRYAGLIAGINEGSISGVRINDNSIGLIPENNASEAGAAGAFAGINAGTIANCINEKSFTVNVETATGVAGGFAGAAQGNAVFEELINKGDIQADDVAAGIAAVRSGEGNIRISNCRNYGRINSGTGDAYGISGVSGAVVTGCLEAGGIEDHQHIYADGSTAQNNYFIAERLSDVSRKENFTFTAEGTETYKAKVSGTYIFKLWYSYEGSDVVVAENVKVTLQENDIINLNINDVCSRLNIDIDQVYVGEDVVYHLDVQAPPLVRQVDKSAALTKLSPYREEDGTYTLCRDIEGKKYSTGITGLQYDPMDFNNKTQRVDMLEQVYATYLK